jgi:hypothetical protein
MLVNSVDHLCFFFASTPSAWTTGEVGCCQAHQMFGSLGTGEAAAQAQIQAAFRAKKLHSKLESAQTR